MQAEHLYVMDSLADPATVGMGIVTSVNWAFNFLLALTWPKFLEAFKPSGSFGWYAAWCGIGWVLIFL